MTKRLLIFVLGLAFGSLLLIVSGCDGLSGDRGLPGPVGPGGEDYVPPIPANRIFSMSIANDNLRSHNGAPKLYLSFDGKHAAAGDTVYSQQLAKGVVPAIDGLDDGNVGWGDRATVVNLVRAAGDFNFITSARLRSAFDNEYIYFQVQWTEVENAAYGIEASESVSPNHWIYPESGDGSNVKRWTRSGTNEDRLNFFFEISPVTRYEVDGCLVTCHTNDEQYNGNFHATRGSKEFMDVWHWTSATSNFTGYAFDRYMDNSLAGGVTNDVGTPLLRSNNEFVVLDTDTTDRPMYMGFSDPNSNAAYPLWDYQIRAVANSDWVAGSTIPGYVSSIPWGSTADVQAVGHYDDGTWTVELRRKRITGNGDDVVF